MHANLIAGWVGFLAGGVAGAIPGLFFHKEKWLGGYDSWERRLIRLAHIAFFGIGLINILFTLSAQALNINDGVKASSILLIIGAITMPLVCYLAAWKPIARNLFFIPAGSVIVGIALFVWRMINV